MNSFEKIYKIKREYSKEDFLRNVLISLSRDTKSPSNVMDAKFSDVTEFDKEILVVGADVEVSYSGSVGFDRTEQYTEYVKKWDSKLGAYVTEPVTKTRIVTDWRPHSGNLSTHKVDFVINEDDPDFGLSRLFPGAIRELKDENIIEGENAIVNSRALQIAVRGCETAADYEVRWPGDHFKDTYYNHKTNVTSLECYIVPCYEVKFTYGGKTYRSRGMAFGNPNEIHDTPEIGVNVESIETIQERGRRQIDDAKKPLKVRIACIVISVIAALLTFGFVSLLIYSQPISYIVGTIISSILLVASILGAIIIKKKVEDKIWFIESSISTQKKNLINLKVDKLVAKLQALGLEELSSSEKNDISEKDDYR